MGPQKRRQICCKQDTYTHKNYFILNAFHSPLTNECTAGNCTAGWLFPFILRVFGQFYTIKWHFFVRICFLINIRFHFALLGNFDNASDCTVVCYDPNKAICLDGDICPRTYSVCVLETKDPGGCYNPHRSMSANGKIFSCLAASWNCFPHTVPSNDLCFTWVKVMFFNLVLKWSKTLKSSILAAIQVRYRAN